MTRQEFFPKATNLFGESTADFNKTGTDWGIMEPGVDPEEWMLEYKRVENNLSPTKEEIKQLKQAMSPGDESRDRIH
jgi:hypothetical protein